MNGRAYDYNLGRFLSVDPVIQSPTNSQSMNPYSYIMNNPLAGTDPTGYMAIDSLRDRRDRMKEREEQSRSRPKGPPAGNNTVGGSPVYVMYFGVGGAANGADGRKKSSEASDIGSQGDSDNTMQRKNNSETYKETKGTGRDMDASETKATLDSIPDSIKYVKSFIEMLESKEGAWFDKVVECYGYDNAGDFEDTRLSLVADSLKVIGRMEYFMANPNNFYYVLHPEIDGDATHYMMHSRVGFGKPFFDGDSRYKASVMVHEMSHTVFAGVDGTWNTKDAPQMLQRLSASARNGNLDDRMELRRNAYLYEFSVMGGGL